MSTIVHSQDISILYWIRFLKDRISLKKLQSLFSSKRMRSSKIKDAEIEIFRNVKVHIKVD
jgi:hypothetical protein